ncbi:hypothetical protein HDU76_007597 [Blyttiomyces sp. JEL0837]|nr:hypothetical protein HDU76_007597 [Blyttiomyces sp. JEL0837]
MVVIFEPKFTAEFSCDSGELLVGHLQCILDAAIREPSSEDFSQPNASKFRIKAKKGKWITKRILGFDPESENQSGVTTGYITYHESCDPETVLNAVAKRNYWIRDDQCNDGGFGGFSGFGGSDDHNDDDGYGGDGGEHKPEVAADHDDDQDNDDDDDDFPDTGLVEINRYEWNGHQSNGKKLVTPITGWPKPDRLLGSCTFVTDPTNVSTLIHSLRNQETDMQNRLNIRQPFIGTFRSTSNNKSGGVFLSAGNSADEFGWIMYEKDEKDGLFKEAIAGRVELDLEGGDIPSYEQSLEEYDRLPAHFKPPTSSMDFDRIMGELSTPDVNEFVFDGWFNAHEVEYVLDQLSTKLRDPQNTIKTVIIQSHDHPLQYITIKKIVEAIKSQSTETRVNNFQMRAGFSVELGGWVISELSKLQGVETVVLRNPIKTGIDKSGLHPRVPFAKDIIDQLEMLKQLYLSDEDASQVESLVGFLELERERSAIEEMVANAGGLKAYLETEFANGDARLSNLQLANCGVDDEEVKALQALCGASVGIVELDPI